MGLKRKGNTIINTDSAGYTAAIKRLEQNKEQKRKDVLLEYLEKRVSILENQVLELQKEINQLLDK